jgi:tRNA threonylcarbamoyladenosine biosynthesis protein TsaE
MNYESFSPEETHKLACDFGKLARPGDIFCLKGPLGAGKTVFAQGLAQGLGIDHRVTSPTFTLMNVYEGGRLTLYHFDLYRLEGGPKDLESLGYEDYFYSGGISVVEWPERAWEDMPDTAIVVEIKTDLARGNDYREISIHENTGY